MDDSEPPEEMAAHLAAKHRRKLIDFLEEMDPGVILLAMWEALEELDGIDIHKALKILVVLKK